MKKNRSIRLSDGIAQWLTDYGDGELAAGVRRVTREMQILRALEMSDPGMGVKGAMNTVKQSLASLGVGK